ncbi:hypothetical protein ABBQ38_009918 [Trebouxia sp. C0009 RCD-2024]
MWKYYDFDANWSEYYKTWMSSEVQTILAPCMEKWCDEQAYYESDGTKPFWKPGADLWPYSRTDYHAQRIMDKTSKHIEHNRLIQKCGDSLQRAGTPMSADALANWFLESDALDEISKQFEPASGSWEAQVLFMGANYLAEPQATAARLLMPNHAVQVWSDMEGNDYTVIPCEELIMDFQRAYLYKQGCQDLEPNRVVHDMMMEAWEL